MTWRRTQDMNGVEIAWFVGGIWSLCAVGWLDTRLPPAVARDLLYLGPLALVGWRLGPRAAWTLALYAGSIRVFAASERLDWPVDATGHWKVVLWGSVLGSVLQFSLVTYGLLRLRAALASERRRANEDGLTGLLNRRAFGDALSAVLRGDRRSRGATSAGALAYIDLDGFKAVNDTRGHDEGDAVLRLAAEVLRSAVRAGDVVARLGGDEFSLWLRGASEAEARAVCERVLDALRTRAVERGWNVGASIGVAVFAERPQSAEAALTAADTLMYGVKRSGKGRVHVALVPVVTSS
ncbi:GGDEF domain-containing protein [Roseisolibacter agri]|uniref:GGDEF domain-containing protein n=1 Tax=Roseisolibacter agri TaxID=2014610 RepID=UPI0024E12B5D|nr:GGDEF domain-containing protein [Roseisolibacter agri]